MNKREAIDVAWNKAYYGQAVGLTIVGVEVTHDGMDAWTAFICEGKDSDGTTHVFTLELSQDPEGNGPGFLFGLPSVRAVKHDGGWAIEKQDGALFPVEVTA